MLTYDGQGSRESGADGSAGWLIYNDEGLVDLAIRLWMDGYPQSVDGKARRGALMLDVKRLA